MEIFLKKVISILKGTSFRQIQVLLLFSNQRFFDRSLIFVAAHRKIAAENYFVGKGCYISGNLCFSLPLFLAMSDCDFLGFGSGNFLKLFFKQAAQN